MAKSGTGGEKTEKATSKKRRDARDEGQVRKSNDLVIAITLFVMLATMQLLLPTITGQVSQFAGNYVSGAYTPKDNSQGSMGTALENMASEYLSIMTVVFIVAFGAAVVANVVQIGFKVTPKAMKVKFSKLNPLKGLKRLFSLNSLFDLAKSLVKIIPIGFIIYTDITSNMELYPAMMTSPLDTSLPMISDLVFATGYKIAAVLLVVAIIDFVYQHFKHERELMMTKYEVKMEYKQAEGDPMIKGKIKQKQREISLMRMMQSVPDADVVITNPTHYAVALKYEEEKSSAPVVVAKGKNLIAQRIKDIAAENSVEIVEDKPLARGLYAACEIGQQIPIDMYQAIAEILAQIYKNKRGRI